MKKETYVVCSPIDKLYPKKKNNSILLGEWCKIDINDKYLNKRNHKILKYHWKNRLKLEKDYYYIKKVYSLTSAELSNFLNKFHKINKPNKYWEQIFGNWLMQFIVFAYDKFYTLSMLPKKKYTVISLRDQNNLTPNSSREANYLFQNDFYNNEFFISILKKINPNIKIIKKKYFFNNQFKILKNKNKKYLNFFEFLNNINKKESEVFIISTYLGLLKETLLQIKVNNFLRFNFCEDISKKYIINYELRNSVLNFKKKDLFLNLISQEIIKNLPATYLEGYKDTLEKLKKKNWPNKPKKIFTSVLHLNFDLFKIWAAEKRLIGSKLVVGQHGLGYLVSKFHSQYDLDLNLSDEFIFWGKKKFGNKKIKKGFNFISLAKFKRKKKENILLIQKFPHKYQTKIIANDFNLADVEKNIKMQKVFLSRLNIINKNLIKIRYCFSKDFYQDVHNYEKYLWKDIKNEFKFENRSQPIKRSIINSKVVILNSFHSTLFYECLTNNIPCIIFTNFSPKSFYKEGIKDYNNLKKIGIIQQDPERLSNFINNNENFIENWWNDKKTEKIKNQFINNYCAVEKRPITCLNKILS